MTEHHNTGPLRANGLSAGMSSMQGWRVDMEVRSLFLPLSIDVLPPPPPPFTPKGKKAHFAHTPPFRAFPPHAPAQDDHTVEVQVEGKEPLSFFGVFDGHGGKFIAQQSARVPKAPGEAPGGLLAEIKAQPAWSEVGDSGANLEKLKEAIIEGFKAHDQKMREVRGLGATPPLPHFSTTLPLPPSSNPMSYLNAPHHLP